MKLVTIPFVDSSLMHIDSQSVVVVIDVLRATSTMITALLHGAREIFPFEDKDAALAYRKKFDHDRVLLCGERSAGIIPGFDLGNSPFEYSTESVEHKTLIMSTTNGTRAITKAKTAKQVILASFINARAVADFLRHEKEIVFLCSGTNGRFSMDDAFCAGYIASLLTRNNSAQVCDLTQTLLFCNSHSGHGYVDMIKNSVHGKLLIEKGFEKDVDYCLQKDVVSAIPVYDAVSQSIKLLSSATS